MTDATTTAARIDVDDFAGAVSDAVDWVLPDLTLIGRDAADELQAMFDTPDPLDRYRRNRT